MGNNENDQRSAFKRFGGEWSCELSDKRVLCIGEAVTTAGPGKGFALIPWALSRYEGTLRLRPADSWLLQKMLAHSWEYGTEVYLSLRKISFETGVAWTTLDRHVKRLTKLGLIKQLSDDRNNRTDRRIHYDVSPFYSALAIAIAADPTSEWAKTHGGPISIAEARRIVHQDGDEKFNFDFDLLERLAARQGEELDT